MGLTNSCAYVASTSHEDYFFLRRTHASGSRTTDIELRPPLISDEGKETLSDLDRFQEATAS